MYIDMMFIYYTCTLYIYVFETDKKETANLGLWILGIDTSVCLEYTSPQFLPPQLSFKSY